MKKFLFLSFAVLALAFTSCGNANGDNKTDAEGDKTEVKGAAVDLDNFSVTLPEGWKEGYKSGTTLNATNEASDVKFDATYNDMGLDEGQQSFIHSSLSKQQMKRIEQVF